MTTLVFSHGFGFTPRFWDNLLAYNRAYPVINIDWHQSLPSLPPGEDYIGIGHSLGFMRLCNLNIKWRKVVSINGFTHFPDFSYEGELDKMLAIWQERYYHKIMGNFYRKCGLIDNMPKMDFTKLSQDLLYLKEEKIELPPIEKLFLQAGRDQIINKVKAEYYLPQVLICEEAGHILGLEKPLWCWENIEKFIC